MGMTKKAMLKEQTDKKLSAVDLKYAQHVVKELDDEIRELRQKIEDQTRIIEKQDETVAQSIDQMKVMEANADLYRKLVNHLLSAVNILAREARNG